MSQFTQPTAMSEAGKIPNTANRNNGNQPSPAVNAAAKGMASNSKVNRLRLLT